MGAVECRVHVARESNLVPHGRRRPSAQGRAGRGDRSRHHPQKNLIEAAYTLGERLGLLVLCQDEAGPYQAIPQPGPSWQPTGQPDRQPHEYVRGGTVKLLTLFRPATGQLWAKPVEHATNAVLHPWLKAELTTILDGLPASTPLDPETTRAAWAAWQAGLTQPFTLPTDLPSLRALLVWDNLTGHKTPELVCWLCAQGVMPLYTPLGGSWLNMATHRGAPCSGRPASAEHERPQRLARRNGPWLERRTHSVRVGWQTHRAPPARPCTSPRPGRVRRVHPPAHLPLPSPCHLNKEWLLSS